MRYVVDGYNLLFRLLTPDGEIEKYRESLIGILIKQSKEKKILLTIVFDAHRQNDTGYRTHRDGVEIVYTDSGQTADNYILEHLTAEWVVVTSDGHLARHVKNSGHRTISNQEFIKLIKPKKKRAAEKPIVNLHNKLFEYYLNAFESNLDSDS